MAANTTIYLGEHGKTVYVDLQYDISSATNVRILFSASAGTFSASVSTLGSNYTTSCGDVFSLEKGIEYIVASGDFSATGADTYKAWIECTFAATAKLISDSFDFVVSNPGD